MMYVTGLFQRVQHIIKESVSSMTPTSKKEYSSDLRDLVTKHHFLNGDSKREIAKKVLIPRDSVYYNIS